MRLNIEYNRLWSSPKSLWGGFPKLITSVLDPKPNKRILDVGCGLGILLKEFEKLNLDTYGIDISSKAIELSKKNCKAKLKVANGEHIPYPKNYFDYVTSIGCLEHYDDTEKGIRELARVLKKEGKALVYVPNTFFIMDILYVLFKGDVKLTTQKVNKTQTKEGWKRLIEKNGLKIISIQRNNVFGGLNLKTKKIRKIIYLLIQWMIPFNYSYSYIYICKKKVTNKEK